MIAILLYIDFCYTKSAGTGTEVVTSADTNMSADIFLSYGHGHGHEYYSTLLRLYPLSSLK
jgi:hypothetical protein